MSPGGVRNGVIRTYREAVEAYHASAHINHMRIQVNTFRLAYVLASAALGAAVGIYVEPQRALLRYVSKYSANRAYGSAQPASMPPCHDADECNNHN